jgi:hypothetical protein
MHETQHSELAWMLPGASTTPAAAVARIDTICNAHGDLFAALFAVLATHPQVPREHLAVAVRQFRRDLDELTPADTTALLTSVWNGGKSGFDAVLRSRRKGDRKGDRKVAALPWMAAD